ncbi:MAG: MotA/TolQ/ExbB proton channel family protein [Phycisphaerales bacterium]
MGSRMLTLATPAGSGTSRSLLEYIAQGGWIGMIIILLSFVAVVMIVAQIVRVRRQALAPPEAIETLDRYLRQGDVDSAIAYCEDADNDSFLTRVMGAAMLRCSRSPFGFLELKAALEETGQLQVARLYRLTDGINLIASIAPMLGLLGTVVGMVGAFDAIQAAEGPVRPDALAGSISQALITTVLGLIVAIPCTAAYTYLRTRIDTLADEVGDVIEELAAHLESTGAPASSGGRA